MRLKIRRFIYTVLAVILAKFVKPKYRILYSPGRRVGNTTRLVDMFIQDFFTKGECQIYDHYGTRQAHERVFKLVLGRLKIEHRLDDKTISIYKGNLILKWNDYLKYKDNNMFKFN